MSLRWYLVQFSGMRNYASKEKRELACRRILSHIVRPKEIVKTRGKKKFSQRRYFQHIMGRDGDLIQIYWHCKSTNASNPGFG